MGSSSIRAFVSLDRTILLPKILFNSIFHTDAPGELFTMQLMLGLNPSMPPCYKHKRKSKLLKMAQKPRSGLAHLHPEPASLRVLDLRPLPPHTTATFAAVSSAWSSVFQIAGRDLVLFF